MTLRILHFSDVHVDAPLGGVPLGRWLNKRLVGGANLLLRRRRRFRAAEAKLQELARFAEGEGVDLHVCTGDLTALGTPPELAVARRALAPFLRARHGLTLIPGNHDVYTEQAVRDGEFAAAFGELLRSDLPEHAADGPWPLVRLVGEDLAVVALHTAHPNPVWDSSGRAPEAQLAALSRVLDDPRLARRAVLVATHYAPRLWDGQPDRPLHGLRNADDLLARCASLRAGALLHGHVHRTFRVDLPGWQVPLLCAGSATEAGHEGAWLLTLEGGRLTTTRLGYREGAWTRVE